MTNITLTLQPGINGNYIYYPDQSVEGWVELTLTQPHKFRGLYVQVLGQAKAHWSKSRGKSTVHYEGIETYINSKTYFFGQHGGSPIEIDAGSHRYNFVFRLPPKLPYSVHFNKGSITYHAEVVLDIPWHFDKNIKVPFTIIRNDDLNLIPQLRVPLTSIKDATFFTFFHESKPLHMTVFIPYSGYTINQNVPIRVTYNNESNVDVLKTAVSLKQIVTFSCHTPNEDTKVKEYRLLEIHASGVKAHEANDFCVALRIPTTAVNSNGMFCKVINIRYVIEVTADVSGLHSNIHNEIPIVIGSLPIDFENEFSAIQIQSNVTQESFDDLPPSYGEAIKMPL